MKIPTAISQRLKPLENTLIDEIRSSDSSLTRCPLSRDYTIKEDETPTLEVEEEVLLLAIRDILTPRLAEEHVTLLHHLFATFYPDVNFNRYKKYQIRS